MTIELLEINKAEKTKVPGIKTIHLEISDDTTIRLTEKYKEDKDFLTKAFSVGLIAMDTAGNNAENVTLSTHVDHLTDKLNSFVCQNQNTLILLCGSNIKVLRMELFMELVLHLVY